MRKDKLDGRVVQFRVLAFLFGSQQRVALFNVAVEFSYQGHQENVGTSSSEP